MLYSQRDNASCFGQKTRPMITAIYETWPRKPCQQNSVDNRPVILDVPQETFNNKNSQQACEDWPCKANRTMVSQTRMLAENPPMESGN